MCDLRMVNVLLDQQNGYTKYPGCYAVVRVTLGANIELRISNRRPVRTYLNVGRRNVINKPTH